MRTLVSDIYILPEDHFTAGHSREFFVNSFTAAKRLLDISEMTVRFSINGFLNPSGAPLVSKPAELILNQDGTSYRAKAALTPDETIKLNGKYVYQFTFADPEGNTYIGKGLLYIDRNADPSAISG